MVADPPVVNRVQIGPATVRREDGTTADQVIDDFVKNQPEPWIYSGLGGICRSGFDKKFPRLEE